MVFVSPTRARDGEGLTRLTLWALVVGLVAGVVLDVLTFLLARYGPSGTDGIAWSFRGNGALVVPFGLGPAVLAGAWSAIVLHYRGASAWLRLGLGAALLGAVVVLASAAATTLPASAGVVVAQVLSVAVLAWPVAAPLLAGVMPVARVQEEGRQSRLSHVVAGVILAVALGASFSLAASVLQPGS
jgi:hypothetical protein